MNTVNYLKYQGFNSIMTSKDGIDQLLTESTDKPIKCSIGIKNKNGVRIIGVAINTKEQSYLDEDNLEDFMLTENDLKEIKKLYSPKEKNPLIIYTNFGIEVHSKRVSDWKERHFMTLAKTIFKS